MSRPIPIPGRSQRRKPTEEELLLSTSPFAVAFNPPPKRPPTDSTWPIYSRSLHAQQTINPIRRIIDVMSMAPNPSKSTLKLHLGDPTVSEQLQASPLVVEALNKSANKHKYDGYGPAVGKLEIRKAVATHFSSPEAPIEREDVFLTCGASQALQLAIEVLANIGDNILVPSPGFPLYATLMRPQGIEERYYILDQDDDWQVDLNQMESLISDRTRAIIVNNPSNPCGAVYSQQHLSQILQVAHQYKLPVIADEIYGQLTWGGAQFHPMATLEPKVPIITVDSISKRYLVPGWRLGWIILHDRFGALRNIREGIMHLAQKIMGPSTVVQGALPRILSGTSEQEFQSICSLVSASARVVVDSLRQVPGLTPVQPRGAFYILVGLDLKHFPSFKNDEMEFCKQLIAEQSLYVLTGSAFNYKYGAIRLVLIYDEKVTQEACDRLKQFCGRHYKETADEH